MAKWIRRSPFALRWALFVALMASAGRVITPLMEGTPSSVNWEALFWIWFAPCCLYYAGLLLWRGLTTASDRVREPKDAAEAQRQAWRKFFGK